VFPGVDGRTIQAKRFQQLLGGLSAEFDNISAPDKSLIRNAAFLVLKCEDLQAQHLRGEPVANDEIIRLSALLNRSMLALKRRSAALDPTAPSIANHWDANHEEHDEGSDA
jgi:alkylhydroperoxidase family enzyme